MAENKHGKITSSTIARITGNIFAGIARDLRDMEDTHAERLAVEWAVDMADLITRRVEKLDEEDWADALGDVKS